MPNKIYLTNITYIGRYVCTNCSHYLTHAEKYRTLGVCPYCGDNSNSDICDTTIESGYWAYNGRKWFIKQYRWVSR